jgi:hypothetical protein
MSSVVVDGFDFGPGTDLRAIVRLRLMGGMDSVGDPRDPTRHLWLEGIYRRLRDQGAHEPLARAYAALADDPAPDVLAGVFHFLAEFPDAPEAADAVARAGRGPWDTLDGHPDPIGLSPAGLPGLLLDAIAGSPHAAETWAMDTFRARSQRIGAAGPCLAPLVRQDPGFLVSHAAEIAAVNAYWLPTLISLLANPAAPLRTRWIAPTCDVVARVARSGGPSAAALPAAIAASVADPVAQRALLQLAQRPGVVGDYRARPPAADPAGLYAQARAPGDCWGAVIDALAAVDPGFALRQLPAILRATPGCVGPILAWLARSQADLVDAARRVRGCGAVPRDDFHAVACVVLPPDRQLLVLSAWVS